MILIKRAYDAPDAKDGVRILVDGLWPRGITKESLALHSWMKTVAPSGELRKWFHHDPAASWEVFEARYRKELASPDLGPDLEALTTLAREGRLTLVYGAKDQEHNQAVVLKDVLEARLRHHRG